MGVPVITFGTDGWRALMDDMFTDENVIRIAHAFVRWRSSQEPHTDGPVAIAYDGRRLSQHYASLFADVLSFHGIHVLLSTAIVPTPVLSFAVKHRSCSAGVMITASHNPPRYNGIKFKAAYGGPFMSEETKKMEECILPEAEPFVPACEHIALTDFLPEYIAQLRLLVDFDRLRVFGEDPRNHAAVIIDSMGGAGQTLLEDLLTPCGWRAQTIFGTADPDFYDRSPEPVEQNLEPLKYNMSATHTLLGIATDGDADRCSIVYDDGEWMNAQETILALVWHLREHKLWQGGIIKTASVTDKLRLLAEHWGLPVFDTLVGFKFIAEVMLNESCMFGGEESGGFGYQPHIPERDGILSGLFFAEMIAFSDRSLHEIIGAIRLRVGSLHYRRIDAPYDRPDRAALLPDLAASAPPEIAGFPVTKVTTFEELGMMTGVKLECGDCRWLLLRTSQTEPLVRLYAEGRSDAEVDSFLDAGRRFARL